MIRRKCKLTRVEVLASADYFANEVVRQVREICDLQKMQIENGVDYDARQRVQMILDSVLVDIDELAKPVRYRGDGE